MGTKSRSSGTARKKTGKRSRSAGQPDAGKYWSGRVTRDSNALDLDPGVFTWRDPRRIARSLKQSAEESKRRKASPFQSAMSMLNFYINRAGKNLSAEQRSVLNRAKDELRKAFNRKSI